MYEGASVPASKVDVPGSQNGEPESALFKKRKAFQSLSNRARVKSEKRAQFHTRRRARSTPLLFGIVDDSYLILPGRVMNGDAKPWVLTEGSIQRPFRPRHTHNHLMSGHLGVKGIWQRPKGTFIFVVRVRFIVRGILWLELQALQVLGG